MSGSVRSTSGAGSNHSVSTAAVTSVGAASNPSLNAAATLNGLDVSHGSSSSSPVGPGHTVSAVMTLPTNSVTRDSSGHLYQIQVSALYTARAQNGTHGPHDTYTTRHKWPQTKSTQFLRPFSGSEFKAFLQSVIRSVSTRHHFLTGQNSSVANQKLPFICFLHLSLQTKWT